MTQEPISLRLILVTVLTLAIAAIGGTVFDLVSFPAAWLTGAMVAVTAAAMARVPLTFPPALGSVLFVVLGSSLGTGVSPDLVGRLVQWPLTLAILVASVLATQLSGYLFLNRVCGWDRRTSFYAAMPGVTSYILVLALPTGADIPRIAMSQTIRAFLLVGLTPVVLTATEVAGGAQREIASLADMALTLVCGTVGGILFGFLGVPAGPMLGAMIASGLLHATGFASGSFPPLLQAVLFVILGAMIGTRFVGVGFADLRRTSAASVGSFLIAVTVAALFAWIAMTVSGNPFDQMTLAFAPGGIDVMTAMAFALNLDFGLRRRPPTDPVPHDHGLCAPSRFAVCGEREYPGRRVIGFRGQDGAAGQD